MVRHAAVVALTVLLAGCQPVGKNLTIAVALLPSELAVYRSVLTDFEHDSGWQVTVVPQQYPDIRRALVAEGEAGRGTIDLVELDVYSLALSASYVMAIDRDALAPELASLAPVARQAGEIDGLRFLPHRLSWQALIYNRAELGVPPRTWDDLLAIARAHPGRIAFKGARYEGLTCDVLPFVWAAGGSGVQLDDPGAVAAFRFFAQLAPYIAPQSATFKEATVAEAMARGEILVHLNWPFVMELYASQGLGETFASAPLPLGPDGRATVLGGGYVAVPRSAPHPAEAVRLALYLISAPIQSRLQRELGWFSARTDLPLVDNDGALSGFAAMRAEVRPRPDLHDYRALSQLWQQAFRAVVFDGADPEATLRAAQSRLSEDGA